MNPFATMMDNRYALDLIIAARSDAEAEAAVAEVIDRYEFANSLLDVK